MRALPLLTLAGCYAGSSAAGDVNAAWRGHARVDVEARLGRPTAVVPQPDGTSVLAWSRTGVNIASLPSGGLHVDITPASFEFHAEAQPGVVEKYQFDVATAVVDPNGTLLRFDSGSIAAGIPKGENIRTGIIYGGSAAAGIFKSATSMRPSLGAYIGGMIGPRMSGSPASWLRPPCPGLCPWPRRSARISSSMRVEKTAVPWATHGPSRSSTGQRHASTSAAAVRWCSTTPTGCRERDSLPVP